MYKNPAVDTIPPTDKLGGFWRGIVEDNNDPLLAGRVRVRIHGLHTPNTFKGELDGIPVNELPWAEPCMPIVEGSVSGFGSWSVPVQGSHVMLFFEGMNLTQPRYFATMPGIPEDTAEYRAERSNPDPNQGFRDPDNVYPTLDRVGEPDVDRLARGVTDGTSVETKNDNRDLLVDKACGGVWNEPVSPYNTEYPHNFVINTHGGITVEMDSTPGEERFNIWHPSKSYIEIDKDGQMVINNQSSRYEIVVSDNNIHIQANRNLTTDNDYTRLTKNNECIQVDGNRIENIVGNETRTINGDVDVTIDGGLNGQIVGNGIVEIDGTLTLEVDGLLTITGNGDVLVESGNVEVTGGTIELGSQGTLRELIDSRLITLFNTHRHEGVTGGGARTQGVAPPDFISLANTATVNTKAS